MRRTESVTVHTCNGCEREFTQLDGDEPPMGYHGEVLIVSDGGGHGGDWFACRKSCIVKAVTAAGQEGRS